MFRATVFNLQKRKKIIRLKTNTEKIFFGNGNYGFKFVSLLPFFHGEMKNKIKHILIFDREKNSMIFTISAEMNDAENKIKKKKQIEWISRLHTYF